MKKLSISDMETVSGGLTDAQAFLNGFCMGIGIASLFVAAPVVGPLCVAYGVISLF